MSYSVERYHDISCGHRVVGHEGKCRHLHGHNYRVTFTCASDGAVLDNIGRVIDFGVVKSLLCMWIEEHWDHKFLIWEKDELMLEAFPACGPDVVSEHHQIWKESLVILPFNPTAENMAEYLVDVIGPQQLSGTGVMLTHCKVEETRKCSASYTRIQHDVRGNYER